ncbi:hypothetical protein [Risungbinella massiliensis]|uniref:hypothetical protein n=1 Tax=Risungbinella massiliensis TaxID=1329796 RepID=UPI0005CBCD0F|nr:hypothetical protein [Risungbinella massiliensis]
MVELALKGSHEEVKELLKWMTAMFHIKKVTCCFESMEVKCSVTLNEVSKQPVSSVELYTENGQRLAIDLIEGESIQEGTRTIVRGKHFDIFS